MKRYFENLAKALFGVSYTELEKTQQSVIESIAEKEAIAENVNITFHEQLSYGQKLADKIAAFGGSWTFISIFIVILLAWMLVNSYYLVDPRNPFDPYPYILLNLVLSSLAALQAPIIMMSQNRQVAKDRLSATENYKVSLKTDLEIIRLHEKLDNMTEKLAALETKNSEGTN